MPRVFRGAASERAGALQKRRSGCRSVQETVVYEQRLCLIDVLVPEAAVELVHPIENIKIGARAAQPVLVEVLDENER